MDPADDYPDFAQPAAQAVGDGTAEFGLLVCTSGVGICITANKVPGVRAGVAEDVETAAVMRQHNDANVLCLERQKNVRRGRPGKFSMLFSPRNSKAAATNAAC